MTMTARSIAGQDRAGGFNVVKSAEASSRATIQPIPSDTPKQKKQNERSRRVKWAKKQARNQCAEGILRNASFWSQAEQIYGFQPLLQQLLEQTIRMGVPDSRLDTLKMTPQRPPQVVFYALIQIYRRHGKVTYSLVSEIRPRREIRSATMTSVQADGHGATLHVWMEREGNERDQSDPLPDKRILPSCTKSLAIPVSQVNTM